MKLITWMVVGIILGLGCVAVASTGIMPLAVANSAVGGSQLNANTPGVKNGVGVNNIGLLVRTWGKVIYVDSADSYFYIDDGSRLHDDSGHVGLRVSYDNLWGSNSITVPVAGNYVTVSGIVSTWVSTATTFPFTQNIWPNLRPRHDPDVTIMPVPLLPL